MTRTIVSLCLALTCTTCATVAKAETPPAQLYSKTITVSYSVTMGTGRVSLASQRIIYVSSKGHIFVRRTSSGGGGAASIDVASGNYSYSGGRIAGYQEYKKGGSGAQQVTISFDPSFRTCTADLHFGHTPGQIYKVRGPGGQLFTSDTPPRASGISCTIKEGNPFGE